MQISSCCSSCLSTLTQPAEKMVVLLRGGALSSRMALPFHIPPHPSWILCLLTHIPLQIFALMLSPWQPSLNPHQFLQQLVSSGCFGNIAKMDGEKNGGWGLNWSPGRVPWEEPLCEQFTLGSGRAQVTGQARRKMGGKRRQGPHLRNQGEPREGMFAF